MFCSRLGIRRTIFSALFQLQHRHTDISIFMTLVALTCIEFVELNGLLVYNLLTSVLTVLPLAIKVWCYYFSLEEGDCLNIVTIRCEHVWIFITSLIDS